MKYVSMAVMGLIVGALAKLFYIGNDGSGWVMTIVLGIAGSFAAGTVSTMFDKQPGAELKPAGFGLSVLGAMVVIYLAKQFNIQF